jgi:hypothetical protein
LFWRRYRGYIERVSPQEPRFEVYFIDFGNKEKLNTEDVRPLDAALSAVPAQARPACLAYVKVCCGCRVRPTASVGSYQRRSASKDKEGLALCFNGIAGIKSRVCALCLAVKARDRHQG